MAKTKTTVDEYTQLLASAKPKHDKYCRKVTEINREYYRGDQRNLNDGVVDNIIFSNISTIIPALFATLPKIKVRSMELPTKQGQNPFVAEFAMKMLLNYYIKKLDFRYQFRRCLYDSQLSPIGVMWMGHGLKTEIFDGNEAIKEDSPFMVRIDPDDLIIDPDTTDHRLDSSKWIARRWVKSLEELKEDKSLRNTGNLQANVRKDDIGNGMNADPRLLTMKRSSTLFDMVEGFDIWDKDEERVVSFVPGHKKLLSDKPWPIDYNGFPCEILYFNENPGELYPIAPATVDLPNQKEINFISDLQSENIEAAALLKVLYNENLIEPNEMDKLLHTPTNSMIAAKGSVENVIAQVKAPQLTQDIYLMRRQLKGDNRTVRGLTVFESGSGEGVETAKESQAIAAGVQPRRIDQRNIIEDFIERIMGKFSTVLQATHENINIRLSPSEFLEAQTITMDKLIAIERGEGDKKVSIPLPWLNVSKDDLKGDFHYHVEAGTTEALDANSLRQDAIDLYQVMASNPLTNQSALARQVVETFPNAPMDILRDPNTVAQEQAQAQQAADQAEQKLDETKRKTDLVKTKMKTDTTKQVSQLKAETEIKKEVIKASTLGEALK